MARVTHLATADNNPLRTPANCATLRSGAPDDTIKMKISQVKKAIFLHSKKVIRLECKTEEGPEARVDLPLSALPIIEDALERAAKKNLVGLDEIAGERDLDIRAQSVNISYEEDALYLGFVLEDGREIRARIPTNLRGIELRSAASAIAATLSASALKAN